MQHYLIQICRYVQSQQNYDLCENWVTAAAKIKLEVRNPTVKIKDRYNVTVMLQIKEETTNLVYRYFYLLFCTFLCMSASLFYSLKFITSGKRITSLTLEEPSLSCAVWFVPWSPWKTSQPLRNVKGNLSEKSRQEARREGS